MMTFTTESSRYLVKSHGNGWAYEVTDQDSGETILAQDDAATQLQADTDNFENEAALADYFGLDY